MRSALLATLALGCRRAPPPPPPAATASASTSGAASAPPANEPLLLPRRFVARAIEDSELLRPHAETLHTQLGAAPGPLDVMAAPGEDGRVILLVQRQGPQPTPIVLVADARRALAWKKERPLAGTSRGGHHASVAGGPRGDVVIAWCDEGSGALAARRWEASGGLLADYQLLPSATCDSLSSLYWPGHGWVVVASLLGRGRAQLLGDNGELRWGREGLAIGTGFRAATPHTLTPDTDRSLLVFGYGYAELGAGGRAVAWRVSDDGRALFRVELGEAPGGATLPFIDATRLEAGLVRAHFAGQRVDVTSDGQVRVPR